MSTVEEHCAEQDAITAACEARRAKRLGLTTARLDDRELATVLAALRYWQRCATVCDPEFTIAAGDRENAYAALTTSEIDELCERLNCGE